MDNISGKIKTLRKERNWTLKDLSQKTELSGGFLSMIERGSSSLTVTSLKKIADAFELDINHFFEKPFGNPKYHRKSEDQNSFQVDGSETTYTRLSGNFSSRRLEPLIVRVKPNQKKETSYAHTGEEFYYVLKGALQFFIEDEVFLVREGESIHFPSIIAHDYENPLDEETILLSVLTPPIF
ncbi:helix-turn-helix domain-containing protein [Sporosarcina sp. CAU 1771]